MPREKQLKLTDTQVRKIRELVAAGEAKHRYLADMYGVTRPYITMIVNGETRIEAGGPVKGVHYAVDDEAGA